MFATFKNSIFAVLKIIGLTALTIVTTLLLPSKNSDSGPISSLKKGIKEVVSTIAKTGTGQVIKSSGLFDPDAYGVLSKYTVDITKQAKENKLKPVVGRENEINMLIQTLTRKGKGNPCIIGEPGIGKTSVVEGLAMKIANGDVPDELKNKRIVSLDVAGLAAGNSYTGNVVSRIRTLLDDLKDNPDIILFFDEVHLLPNFGKDLWKPILNNENIRIIGATTLNEYRIIEEDDALARRFQLIRLKEPTQEETIQIIKGIKKSIEEKSNVSITDEAIITAVETSGRYMPNRNFPDKAIDVVSSAASMVHQGDGKRYEGSDLKPIVTPEFVKKTVSQLTNIPIFSFSSKETIFWENVKKSMKSQLIAQDETIDKLIDSIVMARMGLTNKNHPIASFLFTGTHGVGKTEICKLLAKEAYGDENALININMSRYVNASSVTELIGSYINNKGVLTDAVSRKPYSVVLLDEIEKAEPSIINLLLKAIDNGYLFDGQGNKIYFDNTIFIMTTNSCHNLILNSPNANDISKLKTEIINSIQSTKYGDAANVVDEVIVFNTLQKSDISKLVEQKLEDIKVQYKNNKDITIEFTNDCIEQLNEKVFNLQTGARKVNRVIKSQIENQIAKTLLYNKVNQEQAVVCDYQNNKFLVNVENNNIENSSIENDNIENGNILPNS